MYNDWRIGGLLTNCGMRISHTNPGPRSMSERASGRADSASTFAGYGRYEKSADLNQDLVACRNDRLTEDWRRGQIPLYALAS